MARTGEVLARQPVSGTPIVEGNSAAPDDIGCGILPACATDLDLTLEPVRLIAARHDQRRDHPVRPSPPPLFSGLGGRSRLRSSSLPLDPIRGILSPVSAI
jgi:hypothetical protein